MIISHPSLMIQELLSVKNDIKPVIRQGIKKEYLIELINFLEKEKMHILAKNLFIPRITNNKDQIFHKESILVAYISKSKELAKQAYEAELKNDQINLGKFLGYPECCVNFYNNKIPNFFLDRADEEFSFLLHTFSYTKGKPSFYTNNIFNFQTKVNTKQKLEIYNNFDSIFLNRLKYFLISHVPCSYTCKESIRIGKEILKLLEKDDKKLAREVVSHIRKIFLVLDDFNFISFDGKVKGNSIIYEKSESFLTLYHRNKFIQGNKLTVDNDKIKIFKNRSLLHEIRKSGKKARILDFS